MFRPCYFTTNFNIHFNKFIKMKTIEITLYEFNELSEPAKKVAINEFCDINIGYDWWSNVYEDANNIQLKLTSFNDRYWPEIEFLQSPIDTANEIILNHGEHCDTYQHATHFLIGVYNESDFIRNLKAEYRIMLREEYDYLISDEVIIESIECNEYLFTDKGKFYPYE